MPKMRRMWNHCACLVVLLTPCCVLHADNGLLVHYAFDEGSGNVLHDKSGGGHDGTIKGAAWVKGLPYGVLSFNGKDAFVEAPAGLAIGKAGTLEIWCHPRVFGGGLISWHYEHPATPRPLALHFDIFTHNRLLGTMSDWKNQPVEGTDPYLLWNSALSLTLEGDDSPAELVNRWSHIVMRFDERSVELFRNGKRQASKPAFFSPQTEHVPMRVGLGYLQGIPWFDGMVAEVRVYKRALSDDEIAAHFAKRSSVFRPDLPKSLSIVPRLNALQGKLMIEADVSELALSAGTIEAQLLLDSKVLQQTALPATGKERVAILAFPTRDLPLGDYEIRCTVRDENGKSLVTAFRHWRMPRLARPGVRALNNLVAELLDVSNISVQPERTLSFSNPRKGWIFVSCAAEVADNDSVNIVVDGAPQGSAIQLKPGGPLPGETMCFLPKGEGTLRIRSQGKPVIRRLTVRSIPELMFCGYPTGEGKVAGYGAYDFNFLRKDVLPNINTIVASWGPASLATIQWSDDVKSKWNQFSGWKNAGRRWLQDYDIPTIRSTYQWKANPLTPDQAFEWMAGSEGFTDPNFSGLVANEFGLGADGPTDTYPHRDPRYQLAPYTAAVRRLAATPEFKSKDYHVWVGGLDRVESRSREFVEAVIAAGGKIATEEYLAELPTQEAGHDFLYGHLRKKLDRSSANITGLVENLILVPGILSAPPESDDVDPHVDYKAWMDMQMRYMATAPELFGLGGIMWYKISYSDEEAVRWMGRLFRHYAIEGQTTPLSEVYGYKYSPGIIENADFDNGLQGWTINEVELGAVRAGKLDTLSFHQGRRALHRGNNFLLMRRSAGGPNTASQILKSLTPGKLYSARMIAADQQAILQGMKWPRSTAPLNGRLSIDQVDLLHEKSFVSGVGSERSSQWFDYHRLVFRARSNTAKLTISDWPSESGPGGPIGQELLFNFIEVQPYFDGASK